MSRGGFGRATEYMRKWWAELSEVVKPSLMVRQLDGSATGLFRRGEGGAFAFGGGDDGKGVRGGSIDGLDRRVVGKGGTGNGDGALEDSQFIGSDHDNILESLAEVQKNQRDKYFAWLKPKSNRGISDDHILLRRGKVGDLGELWQAIYSQSVLTFHQCLCKLTCRKKNP